MSWTMTSMAGDRRTTAATHSVPGNAARTAVIAAAGFAIGLLAATAPARADLRLCNKTASTVSVAIGYKAKDGWRTEGWWNIEGAKCGTLLSGALGSRYYYLYAVDSNRGGEWSGKAFMCTRRKMFTIAGVEDCVARGYERTGFFEIDTAEQRSWTVHLYQPTQKGNGAK
jgi:uncharacterized membrane protein